LAFRDDRRGYAAGGDISKSFPDSVHVARTDDGGRTWSPRSTPAFPGGIYGLAYIPGSDGGLVAVGPGGAAYSPDGGGAWTALDSTSYWSVGFGSSRYGWMVGPKGRIARVEVR